MKRPIKSKFLRPKSKMENKSFSLSRWSKNFCRLSKRQTTNLQIINSNLVEIESTDSKILNCSEFEVNPTSLNSNVIAIRKNYNCYKGEDYDIDLYHHGIKLVLIYRILKIYMRRLKILIQKFIWENAFLLLNTLMQGSNYNHRYREECIQNYIVKIIKGKRKYIPSNYFQGLPLVIECPFMDCMGTLVDDLRGCPIRECLEFY
ncbi:hypothetical protein R3W88_033811 [Solanum pinnatisectum]|uniref:Uncharacterized protein n=1 Tax=Solanum pinnatisectum TaxID=50273 RepID=A0AAV9K0F7_9SOLN|nr:hypothetical protein R3W88_033811 [Solanum pinnatisectum]